MKHCRCILLFAVLQPLICGADDRSAAAARSCLQLQGTVTRVAIAADISDAPRRLVYLRRDLEGLPDGARLVIGMEASYEVDVRVVGLIYETGRNDRVKHMTLRIHSPAQTFGENPEGKAFDIEVYCAREGKDRVEFYHAGAHPVGQNRMRERAAVK